MSYDFALERACSHEVKFERVEPASDDQSIIRFPRIPASRSVSLFIDGALVPRSGLYSTAEVPFMNPGPYRILSGKSDLIYIQVFGSPAKIYQLPTGPNVQTADVVRDLSRKIPNLVFSEKNNRVTVKARHPSKSIAFSFPDPRWTDKTESLPSTQRMLGAMKVLGINPGRVASGVQLFPPWTLEKDESSVVEEDKIIRFLEPVRQNVAIFQICYFTDSSNCRRCQGTRVEYDYGVINGKYETVDGADLLLQEFDKYLFTRSGSHFKWTWLGSRIMDRIGSKGVTARSNPLAAINIDISQAFRVYQSIKTQQDQGLQDVSDEEFPYALGGIQVKPNSNDPTISEVTFTISSRSREPIVLKREVGIPDPFFLASGGSSFKLRA